VEAAGDLDVIGGTARSATDLVEVEPNDAVGEPTADQRPAVDFELCPVLPSVGSDRIEAAKKVSIGLRIERAMVYLCLFECPQPIIGAAVEIDDVGVLLE
jgi:hypothetical protein